jgi:hypothetical protein
MDSGTARLDKTNVLLLKKLCNSATLQLSNLKIVFLRHGNE